MQNNERNKLFLETIDAAAKTEIVESIAGHYGTDAESIIQELTDEEAEHILDYMVEPQRSAASVLMQKHNLRGF